MSGSSTFLTCLLGFVTILPAQTGNTRLTMTEVSPRPADGVTVNGITFHFSIGGSPSTDATYNAANIGQLKYLQGPVLEGDATGTLQVDFAAPVASLQFGVARNTAALSPGLRVQLFDPALTSLGVFFLDTQATTGPGEALFASNVTQPVGRAILSFPNAPAGPRFSIDNLAVRFIDNFQAHYFSNVNLGDSVFNITNTGAQNTPGGALTNICVNVYAFTPDEQMLACCSCVVTPNAVASLSARDFLPNTLTPFVPTAFLVKLVASYGAACNAAAVAPANYAAGLAAWGTTLHATPIQGTYRVSEVAFARAVLSPAERDRMTSFCGFIQANGSGYGICRTCRLGGLSADRQ